MWNMTYSLCLIKHGLISAELPAIKGLHSNIKLTSVGLGY